MRKIFRGRTGIKKVPFQILLFILLIPFFNVKFAYSQDDTSAVPEGDTVAQMVADAGGRRQGGPGGRRRGP